MFDSYGAWTLDGIISYLKSIGIKDFEIIDDGSERTVTIYTDRVLSESELELVEDHRMVTVLFKYGLKKVSYD